MTVVVGTRGGVVPIGRGRPFLTSSDVTSLLSHRRELWVGCGDGQLWRCTGIPGPAPLVLQVAHIETAITALVMTPGGVLIGTIGARLWLHAGEEVLPVSGFDAAVRQHTLQAPPTGPVAVSALAIGVSGGLLAAVRGAGLFRLAAPGAEWRSALTGASGCDVTGVIAPREEPGVVLAATGEGLAVSRDEGQTWRTNAEGLPATRLTSVALAGSSILVATEGTGPAGAGVYRCDLDPGSAFEQCRGGLPAELEVRPGCLSGVGGPMGAAGPMLVAAPAGIAAADGRVWESGDEGRSWQQVGTVPHAPTAVTLAPPVGWT